MAALFVLVVDCQGFVVCGVWCRRCVCVFCVCERLCLCVVCVLLSVFDEQIVGVCDVCLCVLFSCVLCRVCCVVNEV